MVGDRRRLICEHAAQILSRDGGCLRATLIAERILQDSHLGTLSGTEVEGALGASNDFENDGGFPRCWSLVPGRATRNRTVQRVDRLRDCGNWLFTREPRPWQVDALCAWENAGNRGVVEAATGTGKSLIGIEAVLRCLTSSGTRALIVVPSIVLLKQWRDVFNDRIPGAVNEQQMVGGGFPGNAQNGERLIIGTVKSLVEQVPNFPIPFDLIVADECHWYGADTFQRILDFRIPQRLGLTATLERSDSRVESVLSPYFAGVVSSYTLSSARSDEVIAPFRLALVGTTLDREEREQYDECQTIMAEKRRQLINRYGYPMEFEAFVERASQCRGSQGADPGEKGLVDAYWKALQDRRDVLSGLASKLDMVEKLAACVNPGRKTLLFSHGISRCERVAELWSSSRLTAEPYHSGLPGTVRDERLSAFINGELDALSTVKALDEGVDVPNAQIGIVIAASRSKRQMIQRTGRVLRRKPDGGEARFIVMYGFNTSEDPTLRGGPEDGYLRWLLGAAEEVIGMGTTVGIQELCRFLDI